MNKKSLIVIGTLVALVVAFATGAWIYKINQKQKLSFLSQENSSLFIPEHAVRMGPDDAGAFLVEYMDPACESCAAMSRVVKELMKEFEGKVQLVIRYVPFHGDMAVQAIKILEAARLQDKYWETLNVVFETQPIWASHHHPNPDALWEQLSRTSINVEQLKKDMERPEIQKIIETDMRDAQTLMVRATPTFFVNGKPLEDFSPEGLRALIQRELAGPQ